MALGSGIQSLRQLLEPQGLRGPRPLSRSVTHGGGFRMDCLCSGWSPGYLVSGRPGHAQFAFLAFTCSSTSEDREEIG